ncbi:MAG TPA: rubrerythrin, partial [Coriobacteriia bacterium]|nr:rubrerythrin [Coriobacteriia bacterium]
MQKETSHISRRSLLQGAAVGAATVAGAGFLTACSTPAQSSTSAADSSSTGSGANNATATVEMLDPKQVIDYKTATNFNVVPENTTTVGTTAENLMSAITGETGAT